MVEIYTVDDLLNMEYIDEPEREEFILMNDLDFQDFPTGLPYAKEYFFGILNGNNKVIKNIGSPLFDKIEKSLLHDIHFANCHIIIPSNAEYRGLLANFVSSSSLQRISFFNCSISVE